MAFKSVEQFNDDRYHNVFRINNDGGTADVIFLYQAKRDMVVANAHYIVSPEYRGYVHCCDSGCPACAKGIRVQTKLFIPVYNISKGCIEFWDRTMKFEPQMDADVFAKFPNPSEFVFRVTRHIPTAPDGTQDLIHTTYSINAVGKNTLMSYDQIMAKFNTKFPDFYDMVIKDKSVYELSSLLQASTDGASSVTQDYVPMPRAGYSTTMPNSYIDTPSMATSEVPTSDESNDSNSDDISDPVF